MRKLSIAFSAAVLALGLASSAHADEWNKLTLLTFSGPVDMPGMTLPAGTYRFELADPSSGRRVIRVSDKEGSTIHGIFLSISNQRMEPSDKPVVMFQEAPSGAPQAVKAWFYPGETAGYEFVYPQDQAMKIAKATHQPVLSMKDEAKSDTTDAERVASYSGAEVARIDESGKPVSTDAELKESSSQRQATTAAATTAAAATTTTTASTTTSTATSTAAEPQATTAQAAAQPTTSPRPATAPARAATAEPSAVGTSGSAQAAPARDRNELPRTASQLPMIALLGALALAAGFGVRAARARL